MRHLFLSTAFILACFVSSAQSRAEKELIRFAIGKDNIYYNETIRTYDIRDVTDALSKDTLFEWKYTARCEKHELPDSLIFVLKKADHALINHQLEQMKDFKFKKGLFKNSLMVNAEKLGAYKKAHGGKLSFNPEDYKNGGYIFTKPILIRHNTVGFINIIYKSDDYLMMYVKEQNKWKAKYMISYSILD